MKQGDADSLRGVDDAEPPFKRRPVLAPAGELAAAGAIGPNDPALGLLTGDEDRLQVLIAEEVTFETFVKQATLNPNAPLIKGVICGYRIEDIETPLTRQTRYLDKLVDELAKGRKMEKILRAGERRANLRRIAACGPGVRNGGSIESRSRPPDLKPHLDGCDHFLKRHDRPARDRSCAVGTFGTDFESIDADLQTITSRPSPYCFFTDTFKTAVGLGT